MITFGGLRPTLPYYVLITRVFSFPYTHSAIYLRLAPWKYGSRDYCVSREAEVVGNNLAVLENQNFFYKESKGGIFPDKQEIRLNEQKAF